MVAWVPTSGGSEPHRFSVADFRVDAERTRCTCPNGVASTRAYQHGENARWHSGEEISRFLAEVNGDARPEEWLVTLFAFAPHDPEQNLVEEVWRQGKTSLREQRLEASHFGEMTTAFEARLERQIFDFPKLRMLPFMTPIGLLSHLLKALNGALCSPGLSRATGALDTGETAQVRAGCDASCLRQRSSQIAFHERTCNPCRFCARRYNSTRTTKPLPDRVV